MRESDLTTAKLQIRIVANDASLLPIRDPNTNMRPNSGKTASSPEAEYQRLDQANKWYEGVKNRKRESHLEKKCL